MIKAVPPGGNWKDIPLDVPSQRLEQIRISGGRTTLYGRLRWDRPSFTITTYFNRPGNGCYIHPAQNRVLTSLEAARIQSFPDSYVFKGSKTSRTKQIGNAVPPLLAFAIASRIKQIHPELKTTADLFCGAGGLTLGFAWAGFKTIVANDFFREAGETFVNNNPSTKFVWGDVTSKAVQTEILSEIQSHNGVDIVIGGPPCQGFSNAGFRMIDDPRNSLYKNFVQIVRECNPKVFIMENVEGILSINSGKTYAEIKETFRNLGYDVEGKKLLAAEYGVPQKRKRVVIIGSRIGDSASLFPNQMLTTDDFLTVQEAIGDIACPPANDVEDLVSLEKASSNYQKLMQGLITPVSFLKTLKVRKGYGSKARK
jgi:site-specific DNA-cytosine methylase